MLRRFREQRCPQELGRLSDHGKRGPSSRTDSKLPPRWCTARHSTESPTRGTWNPPLFVKLPQCTDHSTNKAYGKIYLFGWWLSDWTPSRNEPPFLSLSGQFWRGGSYIMVYMMYRLTHMWSMMAIPGMHTVMTLGEHSPIYEATTQVRT